MIDPNDSIQVPIVVGLTIRQYFAAQAMIGILSAEEPRSLADRHYTYRAFQQCAREAVLQADALIAELNKQQSST